MIRNLKYIYNNNCGTCELSKKMLDVVLYNKDNYNLEEINASFNRDILTEYKVESIPCLIIIENNKIINKIYAFKDIVYLNKIITT